MELFFDECLTTGVGTGELVELRWLHHWASDLDGALSGQRGHLGGSHAERRGHFDECDVR